MVRNTINSYDSDEKKITLEDLTENWKEKLADIPDEELQQLKQQAIEAEDYDIAKMIKQEQTERKERLQESDDSQELEEQTIREESWGKTTNESIQEEKEQAKEDAMAKIPDLKAQLKDKDDEIEEDNRQTRREETREAAKIDDSKPQTNNNNEEEKPNDNNLEQVEENKDWLKDIPDEDLRELIQTYFDVNQWLYRHDSWWGDTPDFAEDVDIADYREKLSGDSNINNKTLLYERFINKIADDAVADYDKNRGHGPSRGESDTIQKIINWLLDIQNKMEEENLYDGDWYDKLEKIIRFFEKKKSIIDDYQRNGYYRRK